MYYYQHTDRQYCPIKLLQVCITDAIMTRIHIQLLRLTGLFLRQYIHANDGLVVFHRIRAKKATELWCVSFCLKQTIIAHINTYYLFKTFRCFRLVPIPVLNLHI